MFVESNARGAVGAANIVVAAGQLEQVGGVAAVGAGEGCGKHVEGVVQEDG